jgi:phytoene dehydrogenase-like protein/Pyruvate/2-oxoacid:ferredoxin oxidoreductase delta subunit
MSITVHETHCTGCQYCVILCPAKAITLDIQASTRPVLDSHACTECGECVYACPNNVFESPGVAASPVPLADHYDAVVIGAGIAGLMTAAGLAKAGRKVLVLEQLSFVGGKYTHLDYQGYTVNTAAWTAPGPKSRIGRLCAKLDAPIKWVTIHDVESQGASWIALRDGRRFASTDEAQETLVGGSKGMAQVYRWIADMYDPNVSLPAEMNSREYIERYFPGNETYVKYVETIITHCFASQTVENFPATETKRAIVDALEIMKDWGTARGGTAAITRGLETALRTYGGQIATRTKVNRILVENGKATGVELADGRTIRADVVVHNAGPGRLVQLVGAENLPADYVARIRGLVPANVAALVLGTTESLLGPDHSMIHTIGWERTLNCYAPTFFDPGLAPPGHHVLDVFWVMQPPFDKRAELELVKAELHDVFPNYDDVVEMELPMFYTGLWTAEMAHRTGQSGADRLDPKSPIENLYLAGYDCIGYGMAGDIIPHGVERALYLMLGDPAYAPADEKASARRNMWLKSQVFKLMALGKRLSR